MLDVASHFAPLYWGFVGSTCFLGATVVQTYMYFSHTQDRWPMKILVLILLALDISSTVLVAESIYNLFIVNFGDTFDFHMFSPPCAIEKGVSSILASITQIYFATRIYIINRRCSIMSTRDWLIPAVVILLASGGAAVGIAEPIYMLFAPYYMLAGYPMEIMVVFEEGSEVLADLLITGTLCYILSPDRTGVGWANSHLKDLFCLMLKRGILVTTVQVGVLVAYLSSPHQLYWMPFHVCKIKLYTNTFLAMLNSRENRIAARSVTNPVISSIIAMPALPFRNGDTGILMNASESSRTEDVEKALAGS